MSKNVDEILVTENEPIVETSEQAINCFLRTDMMRIKQPGKNSKFL